MRKWQTGALRRDPRAWTGLTNFYPTPRGSYRTGPTLTALGTAAAGPATPGTTLAAVALPVVAGTPVVYVGTSTKLYSATAANFQAGSFTDRSRATGYTATSWSFAQFGNITLAANKTDATQSRDATGVAAFADLAAAPLAKILVVQSNAVVAFNLSTGANAWAASDVGDHTNWTTGEAVAATQIRTLPGDITAAIAFRDVIIVFKRSSIYQMRYVGSPVYWQVDLLDDGRGVNGPGCVVNCGNLLIFAGEHGITMFDGSTFRDLTDGFIVEAGNTFSLGGELTSAIYLPAERMAVFYNAGVNAVTYSLASDAFGQFGFYKSGSIGQSALVGLRGSPSARFDSQTGQSKTIQNGGLCLVDLSANPCVLVSQNAWTPASSVSATLSTEFVGDEFTKTLFKRLTPLSENLEGYASVANGGLTLTGTTSDKPSTETTTAISSITSSTGTNRFDFMAVGRFARFTLAVTGAYYEIEDVALDKQKAGTD